jgi:hypothetical protein
VFVLSTFLIRKGLGTSYAYMLNTFRIYIRVYIYKIMPYTVYYTVGYRYLSIGNRMVPVPTSGKFLHTYMYKMNMDHDQDGS